MPHDCLQVVLCSVTVAHSLSPQAFCHGNGVSCPPLIDYSLVAHIILYSLDLNDDVNMLSMDGMSCVRVTMVTVHMIMKLFTHDPSLK